MRSVALLRAVFADLGLGPVVDHDVGPALRAVRDSGVAIVVDVVPVQVPQGTRTVAVRPLRLLALHESHRLQFPEPGAGRRGADLQGVGDFLRAAGENLLHRGEGLGLLGGKGLGSRIVGHRSVPFVGSRSPKPPLKQLTYHESSPRTPGRYPRGGPVGAGLSVPAHGVPIRDYPRKLPTGFSPVKETMRRAWDEKTERGPGPVAGGRVPLTLPGPRPFEILSPAALRPGSHQVSYYSVAALVLLLAILPREPSSRREGATFSHLM